jgi:hypothetical protein
VDRTTRLTGRAIKAVMSVVTVHIKMLHVHLSCTTAALARSMLLASFFVRRRMFASVHVRWFCIFVNLTMHWRLNSTALFVSSAFHAVHGMLLNHVMNMVTFVVSVMTVMFTMHFVMFSHNLPLMLV